MPVLIEVVEKRPFILTENRFGTAKYPVCTSLLCRGEARQVVVVRKFGHIFPEPKCDDCADQLSVGALVEKVKPSSYQMGIAKFFNMRVEEFLDLPEDDRAVLQKFVDAYRKDDMETLVPLVKANKSLIKQYWQGEE